MCIEGNHKGLLNGAELLLWTWLVGALVLLSVSGSKAVTYVLPAMPALAILAARSWVLALSPESQDKVASFLRAGVLVHAFLFFVIAALTPWAASRFGDQPVRTGEAIAFSLLSAVVAVAGNQPSGPRRPAHAWPRLVTATALTYVLAFALARTASRAGTLGPRSGWILQRTGSTSAHDLHHGWARVVCVTTFAPTCGAIT
jgi:4-amino-4-deoxy-L-arabinose transferase-like glycosyltransferase